MAVCIICVLLTWLVAPWREVIWNPLRDIHWATVDMVMEMTSHYEMTMDLALAFGPQIWKIPSTASTWMTSLHSCAECRMGWATSLHSVPAPGNCLNKQDSTSTRSSQHSGRPFLFCVQFPGSLVARISLLQPGFSSWLGKTFFLPVSALTGALSSCLTEVFLIPWWLRQ